MIRVHFFSNRNSWRNLWGLLGDINEQINAFIERVGAKGVGGVNVGPQGCWVTYEDGEFTPAIQRDILFNKKLQNCSKTLDQEITFNALMSKRIESQERVSVLDKEIEEMVAGLEDGSQAYKQIKGLLDEKKSEKKYLENNMQNGDQQIVVAKADMDRMKWENGEIEKMISETYF